MERRRMLVVALVEFHTRDAHFESLRNGPFSAKEIYRDWFWDGRERDQAIAAIEAMGFGPRELWLANQLVQAAMPELGAQSPWFEPARTVVSFSISVVSRFKAGSDHEKRLILEIVGSNPTLRDRTLRIDAAKPFRRWDSTATFPDLRGVVDDVRTCFQTATAWFFIPSLSLEFTKIS